MADARQLRSAWTRPRALAGLAVVVALTTGVLLGLTSPARAESGDFVSTWKVSAFQEVNLPLESAGTYNFTVDWGDSTSGVVTSWDDADSRHTYMAKGSYQITIRGVLRGWRFNGGGDCDAIVNISQWGGMSLGNGGYYFEGATNLRITASDTPDLTVSMAKLRSPLVANWKSPPFADVQLVLSRVPPFALACRMR